MTAEEVSKQLLQIANADNFMAAAYGLTEGWISAEVGIEAVDPILCFMEEHPSIDFGAPGPLTHFIERFYGKGYEEKLLGSVRRKPTEQNVWMLNRLINGTKAAVQRQAYLFVLEQTKANPLIEEDVVRFVNDLLNRLRSADNPQWMQISFASLRLCVRIKA